MRTKTLLLTAALSAAGIATSMAQVVSANVVGYVKVTVKPGFQMIANPLNAADNSVGALLPNVPNGTALFKYDPASGNFTANRFLFGNWNDPAQKLEPGEGAFISNPGQADMTLTFVGEVLQGDLKTALPAGFSIASSKVPQSGKISTDLGFPAQSGDAIFQFNENTGNYDTFRFLFGNWTGGNEPTLDIGESVFVNKAAAASWDRTFSVNQ